MSPTQTGSRPGSKCPRATPWATHGTLPLPWGQKIGFPLLGVRLPQHSSTWGCRCLRNILLSALIAFCSPSCWGREWGPIEDIQVSLFLCSYSRAVAGAVAFLLLPAPSIDSFQLLQPIPNQKLKYHYIARQRRAGDYSLLAAITPIPSPGLGAQTSPLKHFAPSGPNGKSCQVPMASFVSVPHSQCFLNGCYAKT